MERFRPDDERTEFMPTFGCSSIHDMVSSRDKIIEEINYWVKYEAARIPKLINILALEPSAYVELPTVRHDPNIDREYQSGNQITLYDGSTQYPIYVYLPNPLILKSINVQRKIKGFPEVNKKSLKDNFWTAEVTLFNEYGNKSTKFYLNDFNQIEIEDSETETIAPRNLIFSPHTM